MFNFYSFNQATSSYIWDFLITLSGTLIAFFLALYITNRTERRQRKNDKERLIDLHKSKLNYFVQLIEDSVRVINNQIKNFNELASQIQSEPLNQHLLAVIASNDLTRLYNLDTQEIFNAHYFLFPKSADKIKNLSNIYVWIDYLYFTIKAQIESCEKKVEFTYTHQMYIKDKIENLTAEIVNNIIFYKDNYPNYNDLDQYKFLNKYYDISIDITNRVETKELHLRQLYQIFISPFGVELQSKQHEPFFTQLNYYTQKIILKYNHLVMNSKSFEIELRDVQKLTESHIDSLLQTTKTLKNDIINFK